MFAYCTGECILSILLSEHRNDDQIKKPGEQTKQSGAVLFKGGAGHCLSGQKAVLSFSLSNVLHGIRLSYPRMSSVFIFHKSSIVFRGVTLKVWSFSS